MTVSVSAQQASLIEAAVATGSYASSSDVVEEALRLWEREHLRRVELARLKQAYDEGVASGPGRSITPDALIAEFKAKAGKSA